MQTAARQWRSLFFDKNEIIIIAIPLQTIDNDNSRNKSRKATEARASEKEEHL
jgi:hypothetical protein